MMAKPIISRTLDNEAWMAVKEYMDARRAGKPVQKDFLFWGVDMPDEDNVAEKASTGDYDMVERPAHYQGAVEAIEAIEASMPPEAYRGYLKGNTMKYLWRFERKGKPLEDLKKAVWYLERLIAAVS